MNPRVLVADDSGVMRKIIVRSLNAVGVNDVTEAADGVEAFDRFQAGTFEMVLTDWNMPNMTGLELIQKIRTVNGSVPIMMITTEAEKERIMSAIQAGVTDYLVKPFEAEALRAKLEKHVVM